MVAVECWTGAKWEARGATITLFPDNQALMDTAFGRVPDDVKTRFAQILATSLRTGPGSLDGSARHDVNDSSHSRTEPAGLPLAHSGLTGSDVFVVLLPHGGIWMPLSRGVSCSVLSASELSTASRKVNSSGRWMA